MVMETVNDVMTEAAFPPDPSFLGKRFDRYAEEEDSGLGLTKPDSTRAEKAGALLIFGKAFVMMELLAEQTIKWVLLHTSDENRDWITLWMYDAFTEGAKRALRKHDALRRKREERKEDEVSRHQQEDRGNDHNDQGGGEGNAK
jgi:hypothetical protein